MEEPQCVRSQHFLTTPKKTGNLKEVEGKTTEQGKTVEHGSALTWTKMAAVTTEF